MNHRIRIMAQSSTSRQTLRMDFSVPSLPGLIIDFYVCVGSCIYANFSLSSSEPQTAVAFPPLIEPFTPCTNALQRVDFCCNVCILSQFLHLSRFYHWPLLLLWWSRHTSRTLNRKGRVSWARCVKYKPKNFSIVVMTRDVGAHKTAAGILWQAWVSTQPA